MGILERLRVEWAAAAIGILVGITMVYVPYEFGASLFQSIYPHIRMLGSAFMVGAATMVAAMLYPTWPRWIGWLGRGLFLSALATYWWAVSVLPGSITGALLYPLMVSALFAESLPRWRGRGLFAAFVAAVAVAFGAVLLVAPTWIAPYMLVAFQPVVLPVGLLYLGAGGLLALGLVRRWPVPARIAITVLGGLFLHLTLTVAAVGAWTGMNVYCVLAVGCLLPLFLRRMPQPSGVRWRLFRGMALASVLPIVAVGAVASFLAQQAIEQELRDKARQAVESESAWLEQTASLARALLHSQAQDPAFVAAVRERDPLALQARVDLLENRSGQFDAAWMLDANGDVLAFSSHIARIQDNFSHRDYFREAGHGDAVYLSRPFRSAVGLPVVVFSAPVGDGPRPLAVLVGAVSLPRLGLQPTLASRSYHVELFDQRDGNLLRETDRGGVLTRAPVLSLLDAEQLARPEGLDEAFDASGRRILVVHARVPGTPWTVAVTSGLREAFAPVTRMSGLVVAIALIAGALALFLSRWVGRDVAQRLEALRDGFAALGTVSLDQPVPARGDDEVSQLTSGFNEMAARIDRTQKELRDAIAVRDQFLSVASHELRTPLTPLRATLDLLLRQAESGQGLSPEKQRSTLERLHRQVERLTRLVGDMLDVARLQAGRFSLTPAPMALDALAREVVDRVQHSRSERTGPLHLELPEGPVVGHWDEQRLDQLLTNLVENALRYSPPEAPITIRVWAGADGAHLEVEDRGIGIPRDSLAHLFTAFFRARNAVEHYSGGLGLGLSICREIVERHGGTLQAASEGPGQGTRFTVFLPTGGTEPVRDAHEVRQGNG